MLGKRPSQRGLFEADNLYLDFVGRETFYGSPALNGEGLFSDEQFACLYCPDNGRKSVPPEPLAMALILQAHDKVSDEEAANRGRCDVQWKVGLRIELESRPSQEARRVRANLKKSPMEAYEGPRKDRWD